MQTRAGGGTEVWYLGAIVAFIVALTLAFTITDAFDAGDLGESTAPSTSATSSGPTGTPAPGTGDGSASELAKHAKCTGIEPVDAPLAKDAVSCHLGKLHVKVATFPSNRELNLYLRAGKRFAAQTNYRYGRNWIASAPDGTVADLKPFGGTPGK